MAATDSDGSSVTSVISLTTRETIALRDGGVCVLCGCDTIDVAHITAQKASDFDQVVSETGFAIV
jgi:hypothetical protein